MHALARHLRFHPIHVHFLCHHLHCSTFFSLFYYLHLPRSHILHTFIHATPHTLHNTHCRALDKLKRQIKAAKDEKKRVRELIAQGIDPATVPAPNQTVGEESYLLHLHLATTSTLSWCHTGDWSNDVCVLICGVRDRRDCHTVSQGH